METNDFDIPKEIMDEFASVKCRTGNASHIIELAVTERPITLAFVNSINGSKISRPLNAEPLVLFIASCATCEAEGSKDYIQKIHTLQ